MAVTRNVDVSWAATTTATVVPHKTLLKVQVLQMGKPVPNVARVVISHVFVGQISKDKTSNFRLQLIPHNWIRNKY